MIKLWFPKYWNLMILITISKECFSTCVIINWSFPQVNQGQNVDRKLQFRINTVVKQSFNTWKYLNVYVLRIGIYCVMYFCIYLVCNNFHELFSEIIYTARKWNAMQYTWKKQTDLFTFPSISYRYLFFHQFPFLSCLVSTLQLPSYYWFETFITVK